MLAAFITTLPLAVSAFTDRRAIAAAFVIGIFIISAAAGGILTECDEHEDSRRDEQCEPLTGDAAKWFGLVDVGGVPGNVNQMIFNADGEGQRAPITSELPNIVPIGWYLILTGGLGAALLLRYRRITA